MNEKYLNEVRERQQRRLEAGNRNAVEFRVVIIAVTEMCVRRAVDAICEYINWDVDRVAAAAESLRFLELEHLEPA